MEVHNYLSLIEIITLTVCCILILYSYSKTKQANVLKAFFALAFFAISSFFVLYRQLNAAIMESSTGFLYYFFDFGYLIGLILLLNIYKVSQDVQS